MENQHMLKNIWISILNYYAKILFSPNNIKWKICKTFFWMRLTGMDYGLLLENILRPLKKVE